MLIAKFFLVAVIGYLFGSIPFGAIIGRRFGKENITAKGSGKTGATNTLRAFGRKAALIVAALDISKGILAVVFAGLIIGGDFILINHYGMGVLFAEVLAALAAIIGHIWPVFHHFKGGRGVATFFGGMVALSPVAAIFGSEVLIIGAGLTGFASLGSITGVVGVYAILVPLTIMNGFPLEYLFYALIGTTIILIMHRDNIKRLVAGKERRINEKAA